MRPARAWQDDSSTKEHVRVEKKKVEKVDGFSIMNNAGRIEGRKRVSRVLVEVEVEVEVVVVDVMWLSGRKDERDLRVVITVSLQAQSDSTVQLYT